MNRGGIVGYVLVGAIVSIIICLGLSAPIQTYRNTAWQLQNSATVKTSQSWLPCIVPIVIGGLVIMWLFSNAVNTPTETNQDQPQRQTSQAEEEDFLQDAIIEKIDGHTQKMTLRGKGFLIWKDRDGRSYYRELNKGGFPIGKTYYADANNAKELAKHIKSKIKQI